MREPRPPTASSRVVQLDALRGALLVTMAINHVPGALRSLADQPLGYVSSAEGFVLLAGLLAAKVYTSQALRTPTEGFHARALARALHLYRVHVATLLVVFAWAWLHRLLLDGPPPGSPEHFIERPLTALAASFLLVYRPGLLDIIPLYCGLMVLFPFMISALQAGRTLRLLACSFAWWGATNLLAAPPPSMIGPFFTGAFNFGGWQLVFVLGVALGHGWAHARLPASLAGARLGLALAVGLLLCASRHGFVLPSVLDLGLAWSVDKPSIGPLRLLNLLLLAQLFRSWIERFPASLRCPPLERIGQRSLLAHSVHVVVACVILAFPALFEQSAPGRWLGTGLLLGSMWAAVAIAESLTGAQTGGRAQEALASLAAVPRVRDA